MRADIINDIMAAGFAISIDGDEIILTRVAPGKITVNIESLLQELKASKTVVLGMLRQSLPPDEPGLMLIWTNPFPEGSKEAQQASRSAVMTVILERAVNRIAEICRGSQYRPAKNIRQAEQVVEELGRGVLAGQATLEDFTKAVERWVSLCSNGNQ